MRIGRVDVQGQLPAVDIPVHNVFDDSGALVLHHIGARGHQQGRGSGDIKPRV